MKSDTVLSVIIPTKNRAENMRRFLPSLLDQSASEPFEIVVADNGSTDETPAILDEIARTRSNFRWLTETGHGGARARNTAVRETSSPILLFVDDDMLAEPGLVQCHLDAHRSNPGTCILGNVKSAQGVRPFERMLAYIFDGPRQSLPHRTPEPADFWSGNVSLTRETFDRLGGYDPTFADIGYGLDLNFGKRIFDAGVPMVYAEDAVTYHNFDETFGDRLRKSYNAGIAYGYLKENFPTMPLPDYLTPSGGAKAILTERFCRLAAFVIEPFDRGTGVPMKPLSFVYDLGLRTATQRGIFDYRAGKSRLKFLSKGSGKQEHQ